MRKTILLMAFLVLMSMSVASAWTIPKMSISLANCTVDGVVDANTADITFGSVTASLLSDEIDVEVDRDDFRIENIMTITDNNVWHRYDDNVLGCVITYPSTAATTDVNFFVTDANYEDSWTITRTYNIKGPEITNIPDADCTSTECTLAMRVVSQLDIDDDTRLEIDEGFREDNEGSFPNFNIDSLVIEVNGEEETYDVDDDEISLTGFELESGSNEVLLTWTVGEAAPAPPAQPAFPEIPIEYIIIGIAIIIAIVAVVYFLKWKK